jgi:hypothetical protein
MKYIAYLQYLNPIVWILPVPAAFRSFNKFRCHLVIADLIVLMQASTINTSVPENVRTMESQNLSQWSFKWSWFMCEMLGPTRLDIA